VFVGLWLFVFFAATTEAIHTKFTHPELARIHSVLRETKREYNHTQDQLSATAAWAACLEKNLEMGFEILSPPPETRDSPSGPARCNDLKPR
jgi:hypothetical protein